MPWLEKLISLLPIIFTEIYLSRLTFKQTLVLILVVFSWPFIWSGPTDPLRLTASLVISLMWSSYRLVSTSSAKKILFILLCLTITFSGLYFNSLINNQLQFNFDRTFISDNHFSYYIARFQEWSTYLPYRLRPIIFNFWIIPLSILGQTFSIFWFDSALPVIGFVTLVPLILSLGSSNSRLPLALIFFSSLSTSLSRNPDTSTLYLLVLSPIVSLITIGLKRLNHV